MTAVAFNVGRIAKHAFWFVNRNFIAWPLSKLVFDFDVRGSEHVPLTGGCFVAANHLSFLDPPLIGTATPRPVNYMARGELFKNAAFGALIRAYGAFPIRRDVLSIGGVKAALRKVEEGEVVLFFPEGTRTFDGDFQQPMAGAGLVAYSTAAPVIPAYIHGTWEVFPRGAKFPRSGAVAVSFGPALELTAYRQTPASKQVYREIAAAMMAAIARLRDEGRAGRRGRRD